MYENGAPLKPSTQLVVRWPFDNLWICSAHNYLRKDVDFAIRWRVPPLGLRSFFGWHNLRFLSYHWLMSSPSTPRFRRARVNMKYATCYGLLIRLFSSIIGTTFCVARCESRALSGKLLFPSTSSSAVFATGPKWPTERGCLYGQELDNIRYGILGPLPSRTADPVMNFGFSHRSIFQFWRRCRVRYLPSHVQIWLASGSQFLSSALYQYWKRQKTISDSPNIKSGVRRREDGTKYGGGRWEGARVSLRTVSYKRVEPTTVLACACFELVDGLKANQMWRMFHISKTMRTDYSTSRNGCSTSCCPVLAITYPYRAVCIWWPDNHLWWGWYRRSDRRYWYDFAQASRYAGNYRFAV